MTISMLRSRRRRDARKVAKLAGAFAALDANAEEPAADAPGAGTDAQVPSLQLSLPTIVPR